jgi:hypothetical protein
VTFTGSLARRPQRAPRPRRPSNLPLGCPLRLSHLSRSRRAETDAEGPGAARARGKLRETRRTLPETRRTAGPGATVQFFARLLWVVGLHWPHSSTTVPQRRTAAPVGCGASTSREGSAHGVGSCPARLRGRWHVPSISAGTSRLSFRSAARLCMSARLDPLVPVGVKGLTGNTAPGISGPRETADARARTTPLGAVQRPSRKVPHVHESTAMSTEAPAP